MKEIEVNNGCKIVLENKSQGIEVIYCGSNGGIEYSYNIPDGDLVMLLNYYRNCKSGREKSDYISEGKIRNTNTDIVEYIQSKEIVIYLEERMNKMKNFIETLLKVLPFFLGLAINRIANKMGVDLFDWKVIVAIIIVFIVYLMICKWIECK